MAFSARLHHGEHGDSKFAVWSPANIAGANLEEFLKDTQNVQKLNWSGVRKVVRDAACHHQQNRCYALRHGYLLITKAILDDENAQYFTFCVPRRLYGVSNVFISQPAIVGAHGIVRPVKTSHWTMQNNNELLLMVQAIIDEAWKPWIQKLLKQESNISLLKRRMFHFLRFNQQEISSK